MIMAMMKMMMAIMKKIMAMMKMMFMAMMNEDGNDEDDGADGCPTIQ